VDKKVAAANHSIGLRAGVLCVSRFVTVRAVGTVSSFFLWDDRYRCSLLAILIAIVMKGVRSLVFDDGDSESLGAWIGD
jgi:hypothetical protein